jgi:hypothetical protein
MEQAMTSQYLWMYSDMHVLALTRRCDANTDTRWPREAHERHACEYEAVRPHARRAGPARLRSLLAARRVLNGALAILAVCGIAALSWGAGKAPPIDATVHLEQLAARVERMRSIAPDTARHLSRVLALPWYDCARTACGPTLKGRNSAARARLETLIAVKTRPDTLAAASGQAIAAGSAQPVAPR